MTLTLKRTIYEFTPAATPAKTQTKEKKYVPPTITTATDTYEHKPEKTSFIDVVIENKADGKEHSAVYIYPSTKDISNILKNTKARTREHISKNLAASKLSDKFSEEMPCYIEKFVYCNAIFWYSYLPSLYDELKKVAIRLT